MRLPTQVYLGSSKWQLGVCSSHLPLVTPSREPPHKVADDPAHLSRSTGQQGQALPQRPSHRADCFGGAQAAADWTPGPLLKVNVENSSHCNARGTVHSLRQHFKGFINPLLTVKLHLCKERREGGKVGGREGAALGDSLCPESQA